MPFITRRTAVISAAAASAAFGLDRKIAFMSSASAAVAKSPKPFHTFKVGEIEVTTLYDGENAKPHDPGFIKNATLEQTKEALRAAGEPDEAVHIPFTVTVVKTGGRTIMFDSGTGGQVSPTAGLMGANMAAAGIDPAKIDTVILTHFHPDHIFGLMAKDTNAQVFPNAQIFAPAAEMAFWGEATLTATLPAGLQGLAKRVQTTLSGWKNVTLIEGERDVLPGIRAIPAYGHTPGHTTYALGSGKEQLLVLSDCANIPALFARHPGWHVQFDRDPVAAEASRRRMFDRAVADQAIMTGYHFGMPGAGRMMKDGDGYTFVPVG